MIWLNAEQTERIAQSGKLLADLTKDQHYRHTDESCREVLRDADPKKMTSFQSSYEVAGTPVGTAPSLTQYDRDFDRGYDRVMRRGVPSDQNFLDVILGKQR